MHVPHLFFEVLFYLRVLLHFKTIYSYPNFTSVQIYLSRSCIITIIMVRPVRSTFRDIFQWLFLHIIQDKTHCNILHTLATLPEPSYRSLILLNIQIPNRFCRITIPLSHSLYIVYVMILPSFLYYKL